MRFSFAFAATLPLLARVATTFAAPVALESGHISARSMEDLVGRESVDIAANFESRDFHHFLDTGLETRAKKVDRYNVKVKNRVSATDQKARKDSVRRKQVTSMANNAAKKQALRAQQATAVRYSRPRSAGRQKPNVPGYRAKGRAEGRRLPKQPKTPKPQAKKGDRPNARAQAKQAAANVKRKAKAISNGARFADAKARMANTANLPGRKQKFTADGGTVTGGQVRTAIFNSHYFDGNKGKGEAKPVTFHNRPQGPAGARTTPLPHMIGAGNEFPVVGKPGGYQGGGDVGTMRVITQSNGAGGHVFRGVVAHDASRDTSHPGYHDHFQVPPHA